ncbi:hypothetical protein TNIN_492931 [Trichonephila inaurata madagascariensis]|uniref:Uncharacterized protein n=1 Tax=Trichonephila inaurata madagascariensis TaxID=2747483 RepID=A0A8X6INS4_9ARAC|nr:hypothetical protein TNIN_492931 [Trichonephila inaurata madagascariensis]
MYHLSHSHFNSLLTNISKGFLKKLLRSSPQNYVHKKPQICIQLSTGLFSVKLDSRGCSIRYTATFVGCRKKRPLPRFVEYVATSLDISTRICFRNELTRALSCPYH